MKERRKNLRKCRCSMFQFRFCFTSDVSLIVLLQRKYSIASSFVHVCAAIQQQTKNTQPTLKKKKFEEKQTTTTKMNKTEKKIRQTVAVNRKIPGKFWLSSFSKKKRNWTTTFQQRQFLGIFWIFLCHFSALPYTPQRECTRIPFSISNAHRRQLEKEEKKKGRKKQLNCYLFPVFFRRKTNDFLRRNSFFLQTVLKEGKETQNNTEVKELKSGK